MTDLKYYLVEELTATDEPLLWEMLYLAVHVPPGVSPPDKDIVHTTELSRYVEGWGKDGDLGVKVLTSDGKAVGAAWLRMLKGENRGYGYIDDETPELGIALKQEHRCKGMGTRMIKQLAKQALEKYSAISLSVFNENPALRLYLKMGFEIMGEYGSSLTMKKSLTKKG